MNNINKYNQFTLREDFNERGCGFKNQQAIKYD